MAGVREDSLPADPPRQQLEGMLARYRAGEREEVLHEAEALTERFPRSYATLSLLASVQRALGRVDAAMASHRRMIGLRPDIAASHYALGTLLQSAGRFEEAAASYRHAVGIQPDLAEAHNNLGSSLRALGRFEEALSCYEAALQIRPGLAPCWSNLGTTLRALDRNEEAAAAYRRAIAADPRLADAHNNLANVLRTMGRDGEAIDAYRRALEIRPGFVEAMAALASALQEAGRLDEALVWLDKVLALKPDHDPARVDRLAIFAARCDWDAIAAEAALIPGLGLEREPISPYKTLVLEDAPDRQRRRAERYAAAIRRRPLPARPRPAARPVRLRVGYFSADFKNHPVGRLLARTIERHDRSRFEIVGYALGARVEDEMRARFERGFDRFRDLHGVDDRTAAELARRDGIDVAVDLTGFTTHSRAGIFACRAAPVQISYLGYPGSMGAPFIDYIVADRVLIPAGSERFYSEKILRLPDHYQAQDDFADPGPAPARNDLGLPGDGFVFCAINNSYKLTPPLFDIWMALLRDVGDAVLWLYRSNAPMEANLCRQAERRGIDPARLCFTARQAYPDYVRQFACADLFLDSFVYNGGATVSDALRAGLPVVTRPGSGYTARMAASLLTAAGLPELIAADEDGYRRLALGLATDRARLSAIRRKLAAGRRTSPLFDTARFADALERGYDEAFAIFQSGAAPRHIDVEGCPPAAANR